MVNHAPLDGVLPPVLDSLDNYKILSERMKE